MKQEIPLEIKRLEADGGRTIAHKVRHPLDETTYDMTDDNGALHSVPKPVMSRAWSWFQARRKTKCVNREEPDHFGKRYRSCPVPPNRRFGRDREDPPWHCGYCKLFDSLWEGS